MSTNGYLPASELVTVQGNIQLERHTAAAFLAMREDYAEETHRNMTIAAPAGGYRPRAMQLDMRVHPAIYNITPGIIPGLPSDHGFGTEVDIGEGQAWAIVNGARYGFTRTKLAYHDPNHYHYDGVTLAALDTTLIIEQFGEDMKLVEHHRPAIGAVATYAVENGEITLVSDDPKFNAILKVWGPPIQVDDDNLDGILRTLAKFRALRPATASTPNAPAPTVQQIANELAKRLSA